MSGAVPDEPAVPGGEFRPDLEGLRAVAVGLVLASCPAVIGSYLVFRDSHHLTTAFSIALSRRILDALPALPRRGP